MQDTAKYLVHADITADGVVERSDVVGAVFGQTEGLLGDELDLRELQDSSKVGRIDVEIDSQNGQSFGQITIATSLDRVETAILGAALETITRVGPCRSTIEVRSIEDVRAAKRREVVERAKTLLGEAFDRSVNTSRDLVEEVRESVRVEDVTDYEGLPAGPHVADADAIVIVEGRADVLTLLRYGVKNAVAVEGTNVPDAVAELTESRTVTAFLDGDRGGELVRKELAQVGDLDYVAFAPEGRSVEDLDRDEVLGALREKVPYERVREAEDTSEFVPAPDRSRPLGGVESATAAPDVNSPDDVNTPDAEVENETAIEREAVDGRSTADVDHLPDAGSETDDSTVEANSPDGTPADAESASAKPDRAVAAEPGSTLDDAEPAVEEESEDGTTADDAVGEDADRDNPTGNAATDGSNAGDGQAETLGAHVRAVVGESTETVRLLDEEFAVVESGDAADAFEFVVDAESDVVAVVLDGELDQRLLDVSAQRGVDQVVAASTGEFVKQPTSVRVRTADQLLAANEA